MRLLFTGLFFLFMPCLSNAQQATSYRQFSFSPYLYNPAYTGHEGYTETTLYYRKQWIGINDAPEIMGAALQLPLKSSRMILGANINSETNVQLRQSRAEVIGAYVVPLSLNHYLRFGLSIGLGMNQVDVDHEYDNDDAISAAATSNFDIKGIAGILYQLRNLQIGYALPQLFRQVPYTPESFTPIAFNPLGTQLISGSYHFKLGLLQSFGIQPIILLRLQDERDAILEGQMKLSYKEAIWLGAGYTNNGTTGAFAGLQLKRARIVYSYDLGVSNQAMSLPSHEIQLSLRFGDLRIPPTRKKKEPLISQSIQQKEDTVPSTDQQRTAITKEPSSSDETQKTDTDKPSNTTEQNAINSKAPIPVQPESNHITASPQLRSEEENTTTKASDVSTKQTDKSAVTGGVNSIKTIPDSVTKGGEIYPTLQHGYYYIVADVFLIHENAVHRKNQLADYGYEANIGMIEGDDRYYVHIGVFANHDLAIDKVKTLQMLADLSEAWVLSLP